jgi:hypothetical protein
VTKSKADQLRNERRLREEAEAPSTFFQMARAGLDLSLSGEGSPGGYVSGSEPFVRYPAAAPGYSGGPQPGLDPAWCADRRAGAGRDRRRDRAIHSVSRAC